MTYGASSRRGQLAVMRADLADVFRAPRKWLEGIAANFGLSVAYLLLWQPIAEHGHRRDWAVLVGTYFAMFIFADVSVTNMLGLDAARLRRGLDSGRSIAQILMVKNLALFLVAGLPTLILTAALTIDREQASQTAVTVPDVAVHILSWLGLGNAVSVLFPVAALSLRQRWRRRGELVPTVRWLGHLALPYGVYYLVAPVGGIPRIIFGRHVFHSLPIAERSLVELGLGVALWMAGTALAVAVYRRRGLPGLFSEPAPAPGHGVCESAVMRGAESDQNLACDG